MHISYFLHGTQEKGVMLQGARKWKNGNKHASVPLYQEGSGYKGNLLQCTLDLTVRALISN